MYNPSAFPFSATATPVDASLSLFHARPAYPLSPSLTSSFKPLVPLGLVTRVYAPYTRWHNAARNVRRPLSLVTMNDFFIRCRRANTYARYLVTRNDSVVERVLEKMFSGLYDQPIEAKRATTSHLLGVAANTGAGIRNTESRRSERRYTYTHSVSNRPSPRTHESFRTVQRQFNWIRHISVSEFLYFIFKKYTNNKSHSTNTLKNKISCYIIIFQIFLYTYI